MQYTTIVEHSEDGLNLIIDKAARFDRESVLDGILVRKYSVYDIEQMTTLVQEYHARLCREINSVINFAQIFNKQFTTDNNKCFELAEKLFRKIRSSVSGTKKIYRKFCKRMNAKYPGLDGCKKASVFTHSILATGRFTRDLFGEEAFPKSVKILCDELESFFGDLVQIIMVCMEVTKEERRIKDNPQELIELYKSDCNITRRIQQGVISYMRDNNIHQSIDPMTSFKKSHSLQAFLREMFHKFNRAQFTMHVVNEELESGYNDGLDSDEALLWADHHEIVPSVRLVIEHFDELNVKGRLDHNSNKYKIDGAAMARMVRWCYLEDTRFEKTFVEGYFRKHYNGDFITVNANTVNTAKNKFTRAGGDSGYADFEHEIDNLLAKYNVKLPKLQQMAVNF